MIESDRIPMLALNCPPTYGEEAAALISNMTSNGLEGLIFVRFASLDQFSKAMSEVGLPISTKPFKKPTGIVQLHQADCIGKNEAKYWILLREAGTHFLDVIQVNTIKAEAENEES
jgi:hypothetical protein